MPPELRQLVRVRSQRVKAVRAYLLQLAEKLDQTPWMRLGQHGERVSIKASEIHVEPFVLTVERRPRMHRLGGTTQEPGSTIDSVSPMEEIDAQRYERPTDDGEREERRWRQVVRGGRVRLGVKGAPGSGKTFITRHTLAVEAREAASELDVQQAGPDQIRAPAWVTAKALAGARRRVLSPALLEAHENSLGCTLAPAARDWLGQAIDGPRLFLVVDALDELTGKDRSRLQTRARQLDNLTGRVLVTCRTMHWEERRDWLGWRRVTEVELAPFKPRQQREFARKFFGENRRPAQRMNRLLQASYALRHACTTPLLLTFACVLHSERELKEDTSVAFLYSHIVRRMLSGQWRNVQPTWAGSRAKQERCVCFLEAMAWELFSDKPELNRFALRNWDEAARRARRTLRAPTRGSTSFIEQLEAVGLLVPAGSDDRGAACWSFVHRTFLEFLAAHCLARMEQRTWLRVAKEHLWFEPEWLQLLTFLAGLVEDATPLIRSVEQEQTQDDLFGSMFFLKARLIGSARKPDLGYARRACEQVLSCWEVVCGWRGTLPTGWEYYPMGSFLQAFLRLAMSVVARPFLVEGVGDMLSRSTGSAVRLLGTLADEWAVRELRRLLARDPGGVSVRVIARALGEVASDVAVEGLLELLGDERSWVRQAAAGALGRAGSDTATSRLSELVRDFDSTVRWSAAHALASIGSAHAAAQLLQIATKRGEAGREEAVEALGHMGDEQMVVPLLELLRDPTEDVAGAAARALGLIGDERAVDPLLDLMRNANRHLHWAAGGGLARIGNDRAMLALLQAVREGGEVGTAAVRNLGSIESQEAVSALMELMGHPNPDVQLEAALAVCENPDEQALPRLLELLDHGYVRVAVHAAHALAVLGDERAMDTALALTKHRYAYVRRIAVSALGVLGGDRALKRLGQMTRMKDKERRSIATEAFCKIADPRSIDRLLELMGDGSYDNSETAGRALWRIAWKHKMKIVMPQA